MSEQKKGDDQENQTIGYLFNSNVLSKAKAKVGWLQMYKVFVCESRYFLWPTSPIIL